MGCCAPNRQTKAIISHGVKPFPNGGGVSHLSKKESYFDRNNSEIQKDPTKQENISNSPNKNNNNISSYSNNISNNNQEKVSQTPLNTNNNINKNKSKSLIEADTSHYKDNSNININNNYISSNNTPIIKEEYESINTNHRMKSFNNLNKKTLQSKRDDILDNKSERKSVIRKIKTVRNDGVIYDKDIIDFNFDKGFLVPEVSQDPYEIYTAVKCLGEGSFGKVFKVKHKITGEYRAMKVINKYSTSLLPEEEEEILKEINILKMLDHPNIIKVYEYFNTKRKLFILTELCTGGELFDRITEVRYFTETVAAHIMKQIFSATAFCHANNIIHRDLKPENILIENLEERKKDFFNVKIIDFGTGEINKHKMLSEKTGTAYYIAPEVIENNYNEKCDLWSCGVILYILLCGCPPFSAETDDEIFKKIRIGKYHLKGSVWNEISKEAINLISELLTKDYNKRLSAQQALNHPWFKNMFSEKNKALLEYQKKNFPNTHLKEIITNIKCFRAEKKLQQAALAFIVHNLAKVDDVKELKNVFLAFDLDGDGRLTKDELIQGMSQIMTKGEAISDVEKIMTVIDVDNNGFIEYEEFLRATLNKEKLLSKENIKLAFDLFDQDGSGYISKEELKNVLGRGQSKEVPDNVWSSIIKEIDSNSDGEISFDEFYEVMVKLIEKNS